MKTVFVEREVFENDLGNTLTILKYPNKKRPHYVCEYESPYATKKIKIIVID